MKQNALERAHELMQLPLEHVPPLAWHYAQYLGKAYGVSAEVLLLAYIDYAQCVEGLACNEWQLRAEASTYAWFELHKG